MVSNLENATRTSINKVVWLDRGWYPVYYGFCPNEKVWKKELKRLGIENEPYPTEDARCTFLEKGNKTCVIVTVSEGATDEEVIGVLVHEAMHIWQQIRKSIGERKPGKEQEAYALQNITLQLINAYQKTRGFKDFK